MKRLVYVFTTFFLRRFKKPKKLEFTTLNREVMLLSIESKTPVLPLWRVQKDYTDHELWDMGWHDAQWHSQPNSKFSMSGPYMSGWKEARG